MPQKHLSEYTDQVALKIQNGLADEAIEHCRHILSYYPKHLPTYRLLGYASLEKGDYAHATHFFQSVLSADPEDADAWLNLATLTDDLGELEQAAWLMERAFEIEPGNPEIRDRLRHLYSRRDGIDRARIRLTPGALGRLYAAGGFFDRAIHELEHVLQAHDSLPPLHTAYLEVALARAFWSSEGMAPMADKVCQSLLQKLPNCIQANLIMGQIRWSAGQHDEAAAYLKIAEDLDPEAVVARELFGDQSPIQGTSVTIPYLEQATETVVAEPAQAERRRIDDTSWLDHVGEAFPATVETPAEAAPGQATAPPEWLQEWSAQEESGDEESAQAQVPAPEAKPAPPASEPDAEVPDWLLSMQQGDLAEEEAPAPPGPKIPDSEPVPAGAAELDLSGEDLPDWLKSLNAGAPQEDTEPSVAEAFAGAPLADQDEQAASDLASAISQEESAGEQEWLADVQVEAPAEPEEAQVSDWLQDLDTDGTEGASIPAADAETDAEWLADIGTEPAVESPAEALDAGDLPDWLQELGADEQGIDLESVAERAQEADWLADVESETVVETPAASLGESDLPDWLQELGTDEAQVAPEPALAADTAPEDALEADWLADVESETIVETPAASLEEGDLPDWLQELGTDEAEAGLEPALAADTAPEDALEADWLADVESETIVETPAAALEGGDLPDWLQELGTDEAEAALEPAPAASAVPETTSEAIVDDSLEADWLAEIETEPDATIAASLEAAAEPLEEGELPGWLQELEIDEAEAAPDAAAEAAPEADWLADVETEPSLEPAATIDASPEAAAEPLEEGELPDWLQELGTDEAEAAPEPVPAADAIPETAPDAAADASLEADWLADLETEPGPEPAAAIEAAEPLEEGELPDWLQELGTDKVEAAPESVPAADAIPETAPDAAAEASLEADWLADLETEPGPEPAAAIEAAEPLEEGELPDWLQELGTDEAEAAPEPVPAADAIPETAPDAAAEASLGEDWLADLEVEPSPEPAAAIEAAEPLEEGELPDWLQELRTEDAEPASEPVLAVDAIPEAMPETAGEATLQEDWLTDLEAEPSPEPEAAAEPLEEGELPDWLQELGIDSAEPAPEPATDAIPEAMPEAAGEATLQEDWLTDLEVEPSPEAAAEPLEEGELPDWLQELGIDSAEPAPEPATGAIPEATSETASEATLQEDWLTDLEAETSPEPTAAIEAAEPLEEGELPDWLQELRTKEPEAPLGPVAEVTADTVAETVMETPAEPVEEGQLPDWLEQIRPQTGSLEGLLDDAEEPDSEPEAIVSEPVKALAQEPVSVPLLEPVEDMPGWLAELEAEITGQAAQAEPVQETPVPIAPVETTQEIAQETVAAVVETQVEEPSAARSMPEPVEGMPAWLVELEAELGGDSARPPTETAVADLEVVETAAPQAPLEQQEVLEQVPEPEAPIEEIAAQELEPLDLTEIDVEPVVAAAQPEQPPIVPEPVQEQALPQGEAPEWLVELEQQVSPEPTVAMEPAEPPPPQPSEPDDLETIPPATRMEEEAPDWMQELESRDVTQVTVEEMPDWLETLHAAQEGAPDTPVTDTAADEPAELVAEDVEWLQEPDNLEIPEPIEAQEQIPAVRDVVEAQSVADRVPDAPTDVTSQDAEPEPAALPSDETLALAQTYLREGALDAAVELYDQLAHVAAYQEQVIRDLEQSVQSYPRHHALQRILGDAYMRSGQLQKALKAYQQALSKL